jgi:hypothetical protein
VSREIVSLRLLFWKALTGFLLYDMLLVGRDFARIHRLVLTWKVARRTPLPDAVDRICKAVNYASIWYPKRILCLQRSAITVCLLRSCGVPAEMVVGAQRIPFKAHAWTEVNGRAINERRDVQSRYAVWERC